MESLFARNNDTMNTVGSNFLLKLISLLDAPEYKKYVSWEKEGKSFIIHDQANFSKIVLPKYFKHNKFASFVRQLNMYGFRKLPTSVNHGIASLHESIQFYHPLFIRGELQKLPMIKRKVAPANKTISDDMLQVSDDIQLLKNQYSVHNLNIEDLKLQNENLAREIIRLQSKQKKSDEMIQRLIKFLVTVVTPVSHKRGLMINDCTNSNIPSKIMKMSEGDLQQKQLTNGNPLLKASVVQPDNGPLITELMTNELDLSSDDTKSEGFDIKSENFDINSLFCEDPNELKLVPVSNSLFQSSVSGRKAPQVTSSSSAKQYMANNSLTTNNQIVLASPTIQLQEDPLWSLRSTADEDLEGEFEGNLISNDLVFDQNLLDLTSANSSLNDFSSNVVGNLQEPEDTLEDEGNEKALMKYTSVDELNNPLFNKDIDISNFSHLFQ